MSQQPMPPPPENFRSIIVDFTCDLSVTFPEYAYLWAKWSEPNLSDTEIQHLFEYCLTVFPERFFDILYQSDTLFEPNSEIVTVFLPNVDFKLLFNCANVSDTTKKTMWKYLQLILFSIVGGVKDKSNFGDSMNLFDGIDEHELQEKLKDTMSGITDFFKNLESAPVDSKTSEDAKMPSMDDFAKSFPFDKMKGMPDISNLHEHIKTLFDGKIGKMAKEMAEEISEDFNNILGDDIKDIRSTEDAMKTLMKDPSKLMGILKSVGGKLDSKMKSGEISREELMKEASEMMGKMKDMGGNNQMNEMFKNLAKNMGGMGGGKNARIDVAAMERMTKQQATRERLRNKLELKRQLTAQQQLQQPNYSIEATSAPNNFVFRLPDEGQQEKSYIHPDLLKEMEIADNKKAAPNQAPKKKKSKK